MDLHFDGEIVYWRGPAPFHFVAVPDRESAMIHAARSELTYGWGVLPVEAEIGETEWTTSLFPKDATRIGHEETRNLLLRDNDPARPPNEETFQDDRTLEIGAERIDLAWRGANHSPDNILIHLPDHDTMMLVDIVNPGWVPIHQSNLSEDIPGYLEAPDIALALPWKHFIGGHMGRLGTRDDLTLHQRYMADIAESARKAIDTVDPTPYFVKYGDNTWAAVRGYLDAVAAAVARPVIEKYTGVLAAADVFTPDVAFWLMESMRLNHGYGLPVHP